MGEMIAVRIEGTDTFNIYEDGKIVSKAMTIQCLEDRKLFLQRQVDAINSAA